jgi:N-methylhydantoinase A/oxoprolinase/acetone carboxylase beta subunit
MVYEEVATTYQRLSSLDRGAVQSLFEQLEAKVRSQLEEDGMTADQIVIHRIADCRYLGQGSELRVDVPAGEIDEAWAESVRTDFHDIHEREYSRRFEESDIEVPNVRVRGVGLMPPLATTEVESGDESPDDALRHEGEAWFHVDGELQQVATRSYDRAALRAGNRIIGPAIVNQYDTTTVVPPGMAADVDRFGNIVIEVAASAEARALAAAAEAVASES